MRPQTGKATNVDGLTVPVAHAVLAGSTYAQTEPSVAQVLIDAKALISDPAKWTKGTFARNDLGEPCQPMSPSAVCWCISGALRVACNDDDDRWLIARDALCRGHGLPSNVEWNDAQSRTHAEVLAAFDRAIAAA